MKDRSGRCLSYFALNSNHSEWCHEKKAHPIFFEAVSHFMERDNLVPAENEGSPDGHSPGEVMTKTEESHLSPNWIHMPSV